MSTEPIVEPTVYHGGERILNVRTHESNYSPTMPEATNATNLRPAADVLGAHPPTLNRLHTSNASEPSTDSNVPEKPLRSGEGGAGGKKKLDKFAYGC